MTESTDVAGTGDAEEDSAPDPDGGRCRTIVFLPGRRKEELIFVLILLQMIVVLDLPVQAVGSCL